MKLSVNAIELTIRTIKNNFELKEFIKRSNEEISKNEISKKLIVMQRHQEKRINKVQKVRYHRQCNK